MQGYKVEPGRSQLHRIINLKSWKCTKFFLKICSRCITPKSTILKEQAKQYSRWFYDQAEFIMISSYAGTSYFIPTHRLSFVDQTHI